MNYPEIPGCRRSRTPDAALIAAATAFLAIDRKIQAWNRGEIGLPEEESDATVLAWAEHLDRITPMPATSLEGLKAKAAVFEGGDLRHRQALHSRYGGGLREAARVAGLLAVR